MWEESSFSYNSPDDTTSLFILPNQLNDNNICRIRTSAFRSAPSLARLTLSNNRLTTIPEESFGEARTHIARLEIAGKFTPYYCYNYYY